MISDSQPNQTTPSAGSINSLIAFWRREFGTTEPTRVADLVVFPLGVSAAIGMILGVWATAHSHFLDIPFVAYSIAVNVCVQIIILILALAIAFITRRKIWSGILVAIACFCLLAIPGLVKGFLPGAAHWLVWIISLLGTFQITRTVNRHRHSRLAAWMIAVPALVAVFALSYGPAHEYSQLKALPNPPNSPNVLIVIVDTLRADHLSPYGSTRDTSPFISHLAQQGVLFENAIAPSSWTLPAHASMLTGLYPHQSRVQQLKDVLSPTTPTLGDALRTRGYRTAAFSANYLLFSKDHGFGHGFSHFEEYDQSIGGILEKVPLSLFILEQLSRMTTGEPWAFFGIKNAANADKINQDALNWIGNGHRPFLVVLNYFDIHQPVLPPEPYLHMFTNNAKARNQSLYFQEQCDDQLEESCDADRPQFLDTYDGSIRYVDQSFQRLLAQLNERGMLQNTIVVFTSDHGQELGDHGLYGHGKSLYRQEIQVPLIFWNPGLVPAAIRVSTPVSTTDIPATILSLAAPDDKPKLPGQSLAALWHSSQPVAGWQEPISELAGAHWFDKRAPNYNSMARSIVTADRHYIHQQGNELLFDWKADPAETNNLCSAQPALCTDLRTQIQSRDPSFQQPH